MCNYHLGSWRHRRELSAWILITWSRSADCKASLLWRKRESKGGSPLVRSPADGAVAVLGCWSSAREEQEGGTGRPVAMDVARGGQARPRQATIIPLGGREVKNPVINYGKF